MTSNDVRLAVIAANSTLSTNNPKGVTEELRKAGYPGDMRFDILNHSDLTSMLLELYEANPSKWREVVQAVPFDYEKTDSSTNQNTKTLFQNISSSIDPSRASSKLTLPKWFGDALQLIVGSTTTINTGPSPTPVKTPIWAYVGLTLVSISIIVVVWLALKQKSI